MATTRYEKNVTADEVADEFDVVWAKSRAKFRAGTSADVYSESALSAFHADMVREHPQLASSYPVVLRYLCEMRLYYRDVLLRYLRWLQHHPWTSEDSFFESQATYVKLLYRKTNPKCDNNAVKTLYDNTVRMLKAERDAFKNNVEAIQEDVDREHAELIARNRRELRAWFAQTAIPDEIPLAVESAVDTLAIAAVNTPDLDVPVVDEF